MKINLSPRSATTFDDVCMLNTDNKDFESHRISISESHVTLWNDNGASLEIPKPIFNKIVNWYNNPQPIKVVKAPQ